MDYFKNFINSGINLLYELSKKLSTMSSNPEHLINNVVRMLGEIDGIKRVAFYIADSDISDIYLVSSVGVENNNMVLDKKEGVIGFIFRQAHPVVIKDLSKEPLFLNKIKRENLNDISFIGVPIKYNNKVVGVIAVDMAKGFVATTYLVDLLVMISNLIGNYVFTYGKLREREEALEEEIATLRRDLINKFQIEGFIGVGKAYQNIIKQVLKIAGIDVTVMIRGESGTGKTTLAKAIHYLSSRKNGPFIEINCSAIPAELLEAELFGYEKGAFTGAYTTKIGKIEAANGGTLFFDEIGDLNLSIQAKLLRFMQTKEFERLGSNKTLKSNVRIIVATNKNLEEMVAKNEFREDLYYRIAVYPIYILPLRERREDIPALVDYYIHQIGNMIGKELKIDKSAMNELMSCNFPGNVRELINCLTRAAISSNSSVLDKTCLSCVSSGMCLSHMITHHAKEQNEEKIDVINDEKMLIIKTLEKVGYVQAKAARLLNMTVRQLNYRIKKYNIQIKRI